MRERPVDIGAMIVLVIVAMMSTYLWHSHAWADEARPKKVLTVPPGTRRPTHTPSPTGVLPSATAISPTATDVPADTPTVTSIPTATPTVTPPLPSVTPTATFVAIAESDGSGLGLQVGLKVNRICVAENSGTIAVGLQLSQPPSETVIVDVQTRLGGSGTLAGADVDFELGNESIAFFNSQQDAVVNFSVLNDDLAEGDETFLLEIDQVRNDVAAIDPAAKVTEVIILDDDDQNQDMSQYDCQQFPRPSNLEIELDDAAQLGVGGLVPFNIVLNNSESYTLAEALLQITIPIGMALVVPEGQVAVTGGVIPLDSTWQKLEGEISTAAPNGLAGEADILLRLGDIRPDAQATVPLLLEIGPDFDLDRQTVVDVRLSAIHPDRDQSWLRVASQAVELSPTWLPQESEPVIQLFLPLIVDS